jgi:hypothetical protein
VARFFPQKVYSEFIAYPGKKGKVQERAGQGRSQEGENLKDTDLEQQ